MTHLSLNKIMLIAFAFTLAACDRGTVNSDLLTRDASGNNNIYRTYSVDYSEEEGLGLASAIFSLSGAWGTTIKLVEPASLKMNGASPQSNTDVFDGRNLGAFFLGFLFPPAWLFVGATGTSYHSRVSTDDGFVRFDFTDSSGVQFIDQIEIPQLSLMVAPMSTAEGFRISVRGGSSNLRLSARIKQGAISNSVTGSNGRIAILPEHLVDFSQGPIEIQVEARETESIKKDHASFGGRKSYNYSFAPRSLELR